MITWPIENRLASIELLPAFRADLLTLIHQSEQDHYNRFLHQLPLEIFRALGGTDQRRIEPFVAAWAYLHSALLRLDHLQDDDPEEQPLPTAPSVAASYNLVFAAYVLANSILDELTDLGASPKQLLRLRRLWNDCMLVAANGQHLDLLSAGKPRNVRDGRDQYQWVAHAKSGALFALAFAGTAMLMTDDRTIIATCQYVGNIYGALLQLVDDLQDCDGQTDPLNLAGIYSSWAHTTSLPQKIDSASASEYFQVIRSAYLKQVEQVLAQVDCPPLCSCLRRLFDSEPIGLSCLE